jgi:hypothetical protein
LRRIIVDAIRSSFDFLVNSNLLKLGNFESKEDLEGLHEINERLEIKEDDEPFVGDVE